MRTIALNKDRIWRVRLLQHTASGLDVIPANTIVQLWLSATNGGAPINPAKIVALVRDVANPKLWSAVTTMADINAQLGGYANNTVVYVVVSVAGEIDSAPHKLLTVSPIG